METVLLDFLDGVRGQVRALTCRCWRCPLEPRGVTRSRYPLTLLVAWLHVSLRELWPNSLTCRSLGPTTLTWTSMDAETHRYSSENTFKISWCVIKVLYREMHSILTTSSHFLKLFKREENQTLLWLLCSHPALFTHSPVGDIFTGRGGSEAVMHTLRDSLARMFSRAE